MSGWEKALWMIEEGFTVEQLRELKPADADAWMRLRGVLKKDSVVLKKTSTVDGDTKKLIIEKREKNDSQVEDAILKSRVKEMLKDSVEIQKENLRRKSNKKKRYYTVFYCNPLSDGCGSWNINSSKHKNRVRLDCAFCSRMPYRQHTAHKPFNNLTNAKAYLHAKLYEVKR